MPHLEAVSEQEADAIVIATGASGSVPPSISGLPVLSPEDIIGKGIETLGQGADPRRRGRGTGSGCFSGQSGGL